MLNFTLQCTDKNSQARAGVLCTAHGNIHTPIFMPVGTLGSVKGIHQRELVQDIGAEIILGNTYHLYLKPGLDILHQCGGLHCFMHWDRPILTDSGGYQVYSLSSRRKITELGVQFNSHIDGSKHMFTPEYAMAMQRTIGADIIMAFDECTPHPTTYAYARSSMERTHRWLKRSISAFNYGETKSNDYQSLFPIVQGGIYKDLRKISAETIAAQESKGNAIGGVCHPTGQLYEITDLVCSILPAHKPRYLMGVGTPIDLLECIALGVDMFDCVMPTRNGRNGMLFTTQGTINIKNKKWKNDFTPLDEKLGGYASTYYSKAYLNHLILNKEQLGRQIASIHNLTFYLWLVKEARKHILEGTFAAWKNTMVKILIQKI